MDSPKPIRRNAALVGFSRDHHEALLLVWKIEEGLRRSVALSRIRQHVLQFFDRSLIHHFIAEEELLFCRLPENHPLRVQAESEHKNIYRLIGRLRSEPESQAHLEEFADALEKHVRFEERQLFNVLQETLTAQALEEIQTTMESREKQFSQETEDAFWEVKKNSSP